jgi:flagellar hook-length control protein FliK
MALSISPGAGSAPPAEPDGSLPNDAQVSLDGLVDLLFSPLQPQPVLPLPAPTEAPAMGEPAPLPDEARVNPQQWLSAMLDQQGVQVRARAYAEPESLNAAPLAAMERLLARLPVQAALAMPVHTDRGTQEQRLPTDTPGQAPPERPAKAPGAGLLNAWVEGLPPIRAGAGVQAQGLATSAVSPLDSLPAPSLASSAAVPIAAAGGEPSAPRLERTLTLAAPQARWGEQMLHALRETVQVQVQQRFQQATIRLDPPELGSLEIFISHEQGRLSVQISAAQGDVARLLQHTSERLRQELVEQNTLQVSVQISSDAQGHSGREQSRQGREPVIAEAILDAPGAAPSSKRQASGVLVTV